MSITRRSFPELVPVGILILSVLLFFAKIILSGTPLFGSDFVLQFYPWKTFLYEHLRSDGTLPFWNPYLFSGTPFLANIQASMFYPLDFLFYLVPAEYAYGYTVILHFILASVFMYVFVRSLSVNKMGAMLSAAVFTYNGFLMAHLYAGHLTLIHSYIWIPLIFLFVHKFLYSVLPQYAILAGLFLGTQILGGFPQIGFYTILGALLYALYSVCLGPRRTSSRYVGTAALGMGAILVLGFGLAALQLLPTYEFMQLSTRAGGTSYEFATIDSFPLVNFITFLIPDFFGVPGNKTYWISDANWEFWEYCGYVGIGALVLTVVAIRGIIANRKGLFFLLLILLTLFLSLGKHNPLYRFIYYLPGFHHFRIPAQILFLYVFAIAVAAGIGLNYLSQKPVFSGMPRVAVLSGLLSLLALGVWSHLHPYSFYYVFFTLVEPTGLAGGQIDKVHAVVTSAFLRSTGIFLSVVVLCFLYARGLTSYIMTGSLLIFISLVDMGSFSFPLVRTFRLEPSPTQVCLTRQMKLDSGIYRAMVNNGCFPENAGLRYRFQDIQGYDPLILKRYVQYINRSQLVPSDDKVVNMHYIRDVDNSLINMLNLKYILDCRSNTVIKRSAFVPRVHIVHQALVKDDSEVLDYMMGDEFDPMETVVVSRSAVVPETVPLPEMENAQEFCRVVSYASNEITIDAKLNAPGFLVMSEINYPGWQAYVDGQQKSLWTANYLFRGLPMEPGRHIIRFVFRPFSFIAGAIISVLATMLVIGGLLVFRRQERRDHSATEE